MLRSRVIVCLQLKDGSLVKSDGFDASFNYIGDAVNTVRILNEKLADEITIVDISAERHSVGPNLRLLEAISSEAFMPLTYVGGLTSVEQAASVLKLGYEKVGFEQLLLDSPHVVRAVSDRFGRQSAVAVLSYHRNQNEFTVGPSRLATNFSSIVDTVHRAEVGELILYSMDRDGSRDGIDLAAVSEFSEALDIPVLAMGGVGSLEHIKEATCSGASGVVAGTFFCLQGRRKATLISYLSDYDFEELDESNCED